RVGGLAVPDRREPSRARQPASAARAAGSEPAGPASRDSDRRYIASASPVRPIASSTPATPVRLRPTPTALPPSPPPPLPHPPPGPAPARPPPPRQGGVRPQGVLLAPDLAGQAGQLVVRPQGRPPRGRLALPPQQGREPAVEVPGRPQQPVAQLLELLLL